MKSYRYRYNHNISRQTAIVFAVLCLFLSVVFFCIGNTNTSVEKSEVKSVISSFEDYDYQAGRHHSISYVFLILESDESISIDGVCVNEELHNTIKAMKKDTELQALISNNTNTVVELKADGKEILSFDYAQKKLHQEGIGFLGLSFFILALCVYFVYTAITTKERITKEDLKYHWNILKGK